MTTLKLWVLSALSPIEELKKIKIVIISLNYNKSKLLYFNYELYELYSFLIKEMKMKMKMCLFSINLTKTFDDHGKDMQY